MSSITNTDNVAVAAVAAEVPAAEGSPTSLESVIHGFTDELTKLLDGKDRTMQDQLAKQQEKHTSEIQSLKGEHLETLNAKNRQLDGAHLQIDGMAVTIQALRESVRLLERQHGKDRVEVRLDQLATQEEQHNQKQQDVVEDGEDDKIASVPIHGQYMGELAAGLRQQHPNVRGGDGKMGGICVARHTIESARKELAKAKRRAMEWGKLIDTLHRGE